MVSSPILTLALCLAFSFSQATSYRVEDDQRVLAHQPTNNDQPNIIFVLTDDQDVRMDSLSYMPHVQEHLIHRGTLFEKHYCTVALCCPSRVNLWTGKAAHNTNVTDVGPPHGGYDKFIRQGFHKAYLPVWLQDAGYNTYYTGKLLNHQNMRNYDSPFPAGFTGSDFLLDPFTYEYLNATFQRNQDPPVSYEGQYSTDVLATKAFDFLDDAVAAQKPFFLTIAPSAPHCNIHYWKAFFSDHPRLEDYDFSPPIPADRHKHLFEDVVVPRTPNFNPDEPSSVAWISQLPKQNQTNIDFNDLFYRNRLRALQSVDEMIDELFTRLAAYDILDNTYVFYSSDNGFHIGQHRLQPGKVCGFEEDINIPLIVRGPGVPEGLVSDVVTSHTDLAPTFLSLAGGDLKPDFDGAAIPLTSSSLSHARNKRHEHVQVEFWGISMAEGKYGHEIFDNHTYKALRLMGRGYDLYYSVWCTGEHELYDMNIDPYQIHNLYSSNQSSLFRFGLADDFEQTKSIELYHLLPRLDTLLVVLKTCKARACTHPWEVLHPAGDVNDLHDALNPRFDHFYEMHQERVYFTKCEKGFIPGSEGPTDFNTFPIEGFGFRGGNMWSEFV
ncbi:uncharacterized protein Z518_07468 [Rhinocladiella mackenziei CBS 650.93]|uniref:Arylsulfatase n=1 Tax=Rhinocladiella mackenziei CBS 650.93 TaxID=1442369 RepID=A0A0D2J4H9_9EURO|nr:uncharacterized protein Z518_07468 [Rhinocladiella mackenziei CBS 650.93]KIX03915.1 hypothetical protein Z518_07468 [Rhinocladiella mackenziei CBS 650.93]